MPETGVAVGREGRLPRNERRDFHGIPVVIEYRKGDVKPGKDPDDDFGFEQLADYGFIPNTTTNEEGEGLDVFLGPEPESKRVFLVALMNPHQLDEFMEYKVLLGWNLHDEALAFCRRQYFHDMVGLLYEMTLADLLDWTELQRPMAEKLIIRLTEEEEAEQARQDQKDQEPELTVAADEATDSKPVENQAGESTGFANQHRHILLADGRTEETAAPDGPIHKHTWRPDALVTSRDAGHMHPLPKQREPDLVM